MSSLSFHRCNNLERIVTNLQHNRENSDQDYHGEVLRLRVSTDVIHLSASGWLLLLQHHGAYQLRKERTYVLLIVELMQRTTLNQDSFCFQFPSSYNNNEEIARFVYCLFMKRKRFIWGTALWTKMLDSKMSKTTFFLFIGFWVVSEKKSFNGYSAITLFFQGSVRRHIWFLTFAISGREGADVQNEIFVFRADLLIFCPLLIKQFIWSHQPMTWHFVSSILERVQFWIDSCCQGPSPCPTQLRISKRKSSSYIKRSSFRASNTSVPTSGKREVRRARTHFQALSWCRNTTSVSLSTNKCSTTALLWTTARSLAWNTTVSSSESVSCKFLEIMNLS